MYSVSLMTASPQRGSKRELDLESENKELRKRIKLLEDEKDNFEKQPPQNESKPLMAGIANLNCSVCLESAERRCGKTLIVCGRCGVQLHLSCAERLYQAPHQYIMCPTCREPMSGLEKKLSEWRIVIDKLWYRTSPLVSDKAETFAEKGDVVTGVIAFGDGVEWVQDETGFLPMHKPDGTKLVLRDEDAVTGDGHCSSCGWEIESDEGCQCQLHPRVNTEDEASDEGSVDSWPAGTRPTSALEDVPEDVEDQGNLENDPEDANALEAALLALEDDAA